MNTSRAKRVRWLLAACAALAAAGCTDEGLSRGTREYAGRGFASRRIPGVDIADVRAAASDALRQEFRLDTERSTGSVLVSRPREVTGRHGPGRVRDLLGAPNRYRQTAVVRLNERDGAVVVRCQVSIERLDTAERSAFAVERGDDRPTETPIDRLGATSPDTREEWVFVGRDRQVENELLEKIVRHFAATQPGG